MPKLRKMLGDSNSQECIELMQLIETQSQKTLAGWAIAYAKSNYLAIYEAECSKDLRLQDIISVCEEYLRGDKKLNEIKPSLREAGQLARDAADNPIAQAAARAISTACATIQTPTNALGFVFYGAAAIAYSEAGLTQKAEAYDELAAVEFRRALDSLQQASIPDEPQPAKIKWNC